VSARPVQPSSRFRCKLFFFNCSCGEGAGKRFNQYFEKVAHSAKFLLRERIDEIMGMLTLLY
jgi:hypothetical protein